MARKYTHALLLILGVVCSSFTSFAMFEDYVEINSIAKIKEIE